MGTLSEIERKAMATALTVAAERFEASADRIEASLAGHRKAHHGDAKAGEMAVVLRGVVTRLRQWAAACAGGP